MTTTRATIECQAEDLAEQWRNGNRTAVVDALEEHACTSVPYGLALAGEVAACLDTLARATLRTLLLRRAEEAAR